MVCSEVNLALVPRNTWWLDFGATTNISVSMQGCLSYQKPIDSERWIYVGGGSYRTFIIIIMYWFYLDLKDTFVVLSFRQNLVSLSYLDKLSYLCSFGNNVFRFSVNSDIVGTGSLSVNDNLYLLDIVPSCDESFNAKLCGTKRRIDNTNSKALWHKRLDHISKNIIE